MVKATKELSLAFSISLVPTCNLYVNTAGQFQGALGYTSLGIENYSLRLQALPPWPTPGGKRTVVQEKEKHLTLT